MNEDQDNSLSMGEVAAQGEEAYWEHEMRDDPDPPDVPDPPPDKPCSWFTLTFKLPYRLTKEEFVFPHGLRLNKSAGPGMEFLVDQISWNDDDALARIFLSTTVLHQRFPDRTFGECLDQALIWEMG